MPSSNQLLTHAMVQAEVAAGNLMWKTSDQGQTSNQIYDWLKYKNNINTSGTTQFADNYCPTYQNMLDYRIVTLPNPFLAANWVDTYVDIVVSSNGGPDGQTFTVDRSTSSTFSSFTTIYTGGNLEFSQPESQRATPTTVWYRAKASFGGYPTSGYTVVSVSIPPA